MTKLSALLIGSGDSFLLESDNNTYLIDSGGNQKLILNLIPEKINLAICTHNDSDHCNGFLGILKSKVHTIDEIWLPGIWATVIDFIKNNQLNFEFSRRDIDNVNFDNIDMENIFVDSEENIDEFIDELSFLSDYSDNKNLFFRHFVFNRHLANSKIYFNINRICEIARLAYQKGVAIKWFFPNKSGGTVIDNFRPVNSENLLNMKKIKNNDIKYFLQLAYLTSENIHSLVFEYQIETIPRILFTADSIVSIPPYTAQIIVTVPHHGSKSNKQVYSGINNGENLIWIRSDRPSYSRPCNEFLQLKNKYCLSCTKTHPIRREKISFELIGGQWKYISGLQCNCKVLPLPMQVGSTI